MATQLERLQERASTIAKLDLEQLVHPKQSSTEFNFENQRTLFATILKFYGDVALARFECLPAGFVETMANNAEEMIKRLTQAYQFNVRAAGNPSEVMNQIIAGVGEKWRNVYDSTSAHLAFARTFSGTIDAELNSFQQTVTTLQSKFETDTKGYARKAQEAEQQFKAGATQLEKVTSAAREAAKNAGVAAQATAFDKEAHSALIASRIWLGVTITGIIAGIIVVYCLFLSDVPSSQRAANTARVGQSATNTVAPPDAVESKVITATLLQQTIARILIVTLVYTAVVWCGRNYFASRHNYTVNRHRANAMQTFQAFVAGSEDLATRDFILRQAAQCAFSPQQSGYLKDESLPTPGPASQIIDMIKPGSN
jgi:hypothetical protein